jgi:hypothetical protein
MRRGHRASGGSNKVSLGLIIPYYGLPWGKLTPGLPDGYPGDGCSQKEFCLVILKHQIFPIGSQPLIGQ